MFSDCSRNQEPFQTPVYTHLNTSLRIIQENEVGSVSNSGIEFANLEPVSAGDTQKENVQQTVIKKRQVDIFFIREA